MQDLKRSLKQSYIMVPFMNNYCFEQAVTVLLDCFENVLSATNKNMTFSFSANQHIIMISEDHVTLKIQK